MQPLGLRRLQRQDRRADVAAHLYVPAGRAEEMGGQGRRGRLTVGARDGDERRVRRDGAPLAAEKLDIADDLDIRRRREFRRPMGFGMSERNAGGQNERRDPGPVDVAQIRDLVPGRTSLLARRLGVVPDDHARTTGSEGLSRREAGTAEPEQRQRASLAMRDRRHLSGP